MTPAPRPTPWPALAGAAAAALTTGSVLAGRTVRSRQKAAAAAAALAAARAAGERARFARSLADPARSTLLAFYSPDCAVCHSIGPDVREIAADEADWLDVVPLNAEDAPAWAPEVMHYGVEAAPAFVLLDGRGRATARTGPVDGGGSGSGSGGNGSGGGLRGREALLLSLDAVVESGRPKRVGGGGSQSRMSL